MNKAKRIKFLNDYPSFSVKNRKTSNKLLSLPSTDKETTKSKDFQPDRSGLQRVSCEDFELQTFQPHSANPFLRAPSNELSILTEKQVEISKMKRKMKMRYNSEWKLMRVISGHNGWVRCLAVDQLNEFFVSGSNDRIIKVWNLATGTLKLSLTGHTGIVMALKISKRHPYLFSAGDDNMIKCWDLEQNKIIRHYHGHLSAVYSMDLFPENDILCTGGRDAVVRVWDIRTKEQVRVLSGHVATIMSLKTRTGTPDIISGSMDKMIRTYDFVAGKCRDIFTHHKKSIRSLTFGFDNNTLISGAGDNVKVWNLEKSEFERNLTGNAGILNGAAFNNFGDNTGLYVAGTDNGFLHFWDFASGQLIQTIEGKVQDGSLGVENGIFALEFDHSGSRLITAECDKTIRIFKEI